MIARQSQRVDQTNLIVFPSVLLFQHKNKRKQHSYYHSANIRETQQTNKTIFFFIIYQKCSKIM